MLTFSTKAQTLDNLWQQLKQAQVLPVFRFSVEAYRSNPAQVVTGIKQKLSGNRVIIRSSAFSEDSFDKSNAGHYRSVLHVPIENDRALTKAIDEVIASYDKPDVRDEVFAQPMLPDIVLSGVAFTADMDTLAPYYIINYDESGRSDTITGGGSGSFKTYIAIKGSPAAPVNPQLNQLIKALEELELLFSNNKLDVEFAFNAAGQLYILQVRPIALNNKEDLSALNLKDALFKVYSKVKKLSAHHPNLLGHRTVFGVMPDWNPAEIIGLKPKQLSISLYKELITDSIWAYQRDNYGYRNLRSHPLLVSFLGVPYIDVRVDFNSFIPAKLNENIARKLAEYYIDRLIQTPSYHDKIEFEIVHSCYYFNLPQKLKALEGSNFSASEIKQIEQSLLELTNKVIHPTTGLYKKDLEKIDLLAQKYESIVNSDLSLIDKIYWLIEDCKRFGTLPFAGIARAAFIATQFLRSMVETGIISQQEYNAYLNSLNTVTGSLQKDLHLYNSGQLSHEDFIARYGHLRPGTYDIMSLRYDENFDNYFSAFYEGKEETAEVIFSAAQHKKIKENIDRAELSISVEELFLFIKEAIEGREHSKYVFTKSLSKVFTYIEELGSKAGVTRHDMAYTDVKTIMNLYGVLDHRFLNEILLQDIEKNKMFHAYTKAIKLPSLIVEAEDVYGFHLLTEEPNFITLKQVTGKLLSEEHFSDSDFEDKIIFIKSADPGYDFLFSKKIAALVTQFGGANSHMAVRCAELGIPAVIGAGEKNFNNWLNANVLEIDCSNKRVLILS